MKFISLALVSLVFLAAPFSAEAGNNSRLSNTMYMGTPDYNFDNSQSFSAVASTGDSEVLVSNSGVWEAIQYRANAVRNGTAANQLISNTSVGTSAAAAGSFSRNNNFNNSNRHSYSNNNNNSNSYNSNNSNGYNSNNSNTRYSTNNTGSNRYLNNPVNNNSLTDRNANARYNFQYGGYTIQNQINNQRQNAAYDNSRLLRYNFKGDPATYNGAPYQNFRGYNNFAGSINVFGPVYNLGYYNR